MENRREFIKKAAFLAGSTGLWSTLPPSLKRALEINPAPGSTFYDAEHIVLLMQENRSFDHCFGTLKGVRGFNDPRAITLPNKNLVWMQSDKAGNTYAPFRLNIKDTKSTWMGNLPHSWENQVDARNKGKHNGWLEAKRSGYKEYKELPLTLGYFNRDDIPFYYAFADAFTICDQHFCSSLTGTTTNRLFFWSGTLKSGPGAQANVRNSDVYYNNEANWKTFPERLEENGISWKVYQNEVSLQTELEGDNEYWLGNFTDNNLEWFKQYHIRFSVGHHRFLTNRIEQLPEEIAQLNKTLEKQKPSQTQPLKKKITQKTAQLAKYKAELAKYNPENFAQLSAFEQHLHQKAFTTNIADPNYHQLEELAYDDQGTERKLNVPKGDVLHQFREDVNTGNLPTVSWLVAPQAFSDHPSSPWFGAWYVSEVLDILTKNPAVWKKTIFILTYDENDGYFDHIPPFVAPNPNDPDSGAVSHGIDTADEYVTMEEEMKRDMDEKYRREGPVGLGYRVPLVIASPWSRGGWVNSEVCDITSTIQFMEKFLEKKTGKLIQETNISSWRRTVTGDLTSVFRPYNGEEIALPTPVERNPFVQSINNARFKVLPSGYKRFTANEIAETNKNPIQSSLLPKQEPGIKDANALPYELYVEGKRPDKSTIELSFHAASAVFGKRAVGAAFNVYAPGNFLQQKNNQMVFEPVKAWSFAVKAGDRLSHQWPLNHFENQQYHLRVYGPNGFFRELKGKGDDPMLTIECLYQLASDSPVALTGNMELSIENLVKASKEPIRIELEDWAYGNGVITRQIKAGEKIVLEINTAKSYGWYDFSLRVKGVSGFERRYAGRVETGKASKSDPFMGRVN